MSVRIPARGLLRRFPRGVDFLLAGILLLAASSIPAVKPAETSSSTWLGLRPFTADIIRMHALSVVGVAGLDREYPGTDPTRGALAERLEMAMRLTPDRHEVIWDDALLLSALGDSAGARRYLRAAREFHPRPEEIDLFEAAWFLWIDQADTTGAVTMLMESWNRGALSRPGKRFAVSLVGAAGDHAQRLALERRLAEESGNGESTVHGAE